MVKVLRFIKTDEDTIMLTVPASLRGKFVEIEITEKMSDDAFAMEDPVMASHNEMELQMLDKMRNQLNVWDI